MRALTVLGMLLAGCAASAACSAFGSGDGGGGATDAGAGDGSPANANADGGTGGGSVDGSASDAGSADGGGPCVIIADNEDVRGPLAAAEPALYWVNGAMNAVRIFESGSTATAFANPGPGVLTAVAVAPTGGYVAWSADLGDAGGVLHFDTFTTLNKGPSAAGVVPTSFGVVGTTVLGVALDRTQHNADLFRFTGAGTYDTFRQIGPSIGYAVTTDDGWVYVETDGGLEGLSTTTAVAATPGPGIAPALASNGSSAFFLDGKQVVKTVGPAIALVASAVDAVQLAADQTALFYFSAPPSTLFRRDLSTTAVTAIADVPAGAERLVASAHFLYYVVSGQRVVRCAKPL